MSKLALSEGKKIITLNQEGQAQFNIMNSPDHSNPNSQHPIIFKIKTNTIQNITVKPIYGILMHSGNQTNKKITVKYSGEKEDLKKVKLQIRWLRLPPNLEALNQEGKKVIYPEIYRECQTKDGQKHEEITFQFKKQNSKDMINTNQPKQFRFQSKKFEIQHQRTAQMQKKISSKPQRQIEGTKTAITIKQVVILMFFSLLLGISFGIRLNRMEKEEVGLQTNRVLSSSQNVPQL